MTGIMSSLSKPLERLPTMFVKDCGYIPVVLTNAAYAIEKNIRTKHIFQTQGNVSKVNASLNRLAAPRVSKLKDDNIHDIIEALKTFLVRLPEPLLPEAVCDELISVPQDDNFMSRYAAIMTDYRKSSPHNFAALHFMMMLLKKISEHSEHNGMDIRKLATVFVLDVLKPLRLEEANEQGMVVIDRMQRLPYLIMVVENFINQVELFKTVPSIRVTAQSPRGSVISTTRSSLGISPGTCRSSFTETRILAKQLELGQHDDATFTSTKDQDSQVATEMFDYTAEALSGWASFDLLARTMSEPEHLNAFNVDMPHRCTTDIPLCGNGAFCKFQDHPLNINFTTSGCQSVAEFKTPAHPTEVCLESGTKVTCPAPVIFTDATEMIFPYVEKRCRTSYGSTCSPVEKKSTHSERDETAHNTYSMSNVKTNRSVDNRLISAQGKRKRKSRSTCRKTVKQDKDQGLIDSFCRSSDFVTFQPDEEITPWSEGSIKSDDASVMVKTIRNPRIMSYKTTTRLNYVKENGDKTNPKGKERVISTDDASQLRMPNSFFRTISKQSNMSATSSSSQSSASSILDQCPILRPDPLSEVCVQCSSREATPISKDLIRSVKVSGGVGVNTSPYPNNSSSHGNHEEPSKLCHELNENLASKSSLIISREHRGSSRGSTTRSKNPSTATRRKSFINPAATKSQIRNTTSTNPAAIAISSKTDNRTASRGQGYVPKSHSSLLQQHAPRPVAPKQVVNIPAVIYTPSNVHKFRQLRKTLRTPSCGQERKGNDHSMRYAPSKRLSVGEWFVNIILVCVTLFCFFLIFFYQYSHGREGVLGH